VLATGYLPRAHKRRLNPTPPTPYNPHRAPRTLHLHLPGHQPIDKEDMERAVKNLKALGRSLDIITLKNRGVCPRPALSPSFPPIHSPLTKLS